MKGLELTGRSRQSIPPDARCRPSKLPAAAVALAAALLAGPLLAQEADTGFLVAPPDTPRPFTSMPLGWAFAVAGAFALLGALRALLPASWRMAPASWIRSLFAHALRIGWLAVVPAMVLDGLIFFLGEEYHHGWSILVLTLAFSPFAAGLQWEKGRWDHRRNREEAYPRAFNYCAGLLLTALIPALLIDQGLAVLWKAGRLSQAALPFNLLALGAVSGSTAFLLAKLVKVVLLALALPHRLVRFFIDPASRFHAIILVLPLAAMAAFHYQTLPFFVEVLSFTLPPVPAASLDQALVIILPNLMTIICVIYFSIFAGMFISMLPVIAFSRSLRREPKRGPILDELLRSPEESRRYLGRELRAEEIWPTIVTVTAYNEPADPLEKTLAGYLRLVKAWLERGLPPEKYIILFSHQTEREEERIEFERFLALRFPQCDPLGLIDRDWAAFDEDDPGASIRGESRLYEVLAAWLEHKGLDPDSRAGKAEHQKRRVCQRLFEFSAHAPRELFGLPPAPPRTYGPRRVESWIWYYLIPKQVGSHTIQVNSKAHNLYYAREAVWGKAESSPLARDGLFHDAPEWLFDASDADSEIHPSCVEGILATYTPFYKEPGLGWIQRLSYTIDPGATFLSSIKSASETAYWSWYLRARIHTYVRGGELLRRRIGRFVRPVRRDFQAANGHNMVVRGTSVKEAGGDLEHQQATVWRIASPLKRWLARLRGDEVPCETKLVEKWVPTGEDLELATRMALQGYYGDYAAYAPQGEGSPADFRGNVPQAIRWSGNNVQLVFMHLASVFSSRLLTFNEKLGYFINLATLASAPLLYLTVLRAAFLPFLDIPDVYSVIHPGFGPFAVILALAPNFLLFSLALTGQLVVKPTAPWQRSVLKPSQQRLLLWLGCLLVPPATIFTAAMLPGWLGSAGIEVSTEMGWSLLGGAVLFNVIGLLLKRDAYASIAYCVVLLPFLQVLYLAWIIFGIIGTVNMIVKTQIVEPYISRLLGTYHPPEAGRYPADASGRFLPLTDRLPWLFAPCRWLKQGHAPAALVLGAAAGGLFWFHPPEGWSKQLAGSLAFAAAAFWLWKRLPGLMDDWFLDRDSLANRAWDYWTNPQPAFVKTIKERQERSLGTLLKDNVFGLVNGLLILFLILHVHFVNAADFSAALLAYLTFSIAASWIISPFFYEEPRRTQRSQGKALAIAAAAAAAFLALPLGLGEELEAGFGLKVIPAALVPWLQGLLGAVFLATLVNLAPWPKARAFAKRCALACVTLGLLFLSGLAVSYRGVAVEPLQESWAIEADRSFVEAVREEEITLLRLDDLERRLEVAEREARVAHLRERLALAQLEDLRARKAPEGRKALEHADRELELADRRLEAELEKARARGDLQSLRAGALPEDASGREALFESLLGWAREERRRRRLAYQEGRDRAAAFRRKLEEKEGAGHEAESEELRSFLASFEGGVVARLRDAAESAERIAARLEIERELPLRGGPEAEISALQDLPLLAGGDLGGAQELRELALHDLDEARRFSEQIERELRDAEQALATESQKRRAAWERRETLQAQLAIAPRGAQRLAALRAEAADRARRVFWARPRRYDAFQKMLSRYRPVLEVEAAREELSSALRWIATQHPLKRVVLEGAPWYPKKTLLESLESELPELLERLARAEERYLDRRREAELLLASRSRLLALLFLAELAQDGAILPAQPQVLRRLHELRAEPEELLDMEAMEDLLSDFDATLELRRLEAQRGKLESSREARLARAGLESYLALAGGRRDSLQPLANAWVAGGLEEKHRQALERELEGIRRDALRVETERLAAWRDAIREAARQQREQRVLHIFSALPPADAGEPGLAAELSFVLRSWEIAGALDAAVEAGLEAQELRRRAEFLEDAILAEIDRLEPYLIGSPADEELEKPQPYPIFLLRRAKARLALELREAHELLVSRIESEERHESRRLTKELRPRRDGLKDELLGELKARRDAVLAAAHDGWLEALIRRLLVAKLERAAGALRLLLEGGMPAEGAEGGGEGRGLLEILAGAREEAERAAGIAGESPQDASLRQAAYRKRTRADVLEARVRENWEHIEEAIETSAALEGLLWDAFRSRQLELVDAALDRRLDPEHVARSVEAAIGPADLLAEEIRQADDEIARLERGGVGIEEVRALLASPGGTVAPSPRVETAARVAALRRELERLEASRRAASPSASRLEPPSVAPAAGTTRSSALLALESGGGGAEESASRPAPPSLELDQEAAVLQAIEQARRPGGSLFLAEKDIEAALEELRRSSLRFLPEFFATAGASSAAPSVGQGGGFGLVVLSLDLLENRRAFSERAEERRHLRELAELLETMKALRAHGAVVTAEMKVALRRRALESVAARLERARRLPGADPASDAWLRLAEERLRTALYGAERSLQERRRTLNSLRGAPLEEELRAGPEDVSSLTEARAHLDGWLRRAEALLAARFPRHPAFQALLRGLEKLGAQEEEMRLRGAWPALYAGAGAAAPSEGLFTAGASLIFPVVDRKSDLAASAASVEQQLLLASERRTLFEERLRRRGAELHRELSAAELELEEELLAGRLEALDEAVREHERGILRRSAEIDGEVGSLNEALEAQGTRLDLYLSSALDLIESGARLSEEAAAREEPPQEGPEPRREALDEALAAACEASPTVALERGKLAHLEMRFEREGKLVERIGLGAGVSYAGLFLPLPAIELTYGSSENRKAAAEAGLRSARDRSRAAEVAARRTALEARLDWARDAELERLAAARVEAARGVLETARRQVESGREPQRTLAAAKLRSLEAERDFLAARGARRLAAERYLALTGAGESDAPPFNPEALEAEISPQSPALAECREALVRRALENEVEYRWRELIATLENKQPYGGNIGNLLKPIWDTVRLWRRPGSREEVEAQLSRLGSFLLEEEEEGSADEQARKAGEVLDETKSMVGGDAFDPGEVGKAILLWRDALLILESREREAQEGLLLAREEERSSRDDLERLSARRGRLQEELEMERSAAAVGDGRPLRVLALRQEILALEADEVRSLHRQARARAERCYHEDGRESAGGEDPPAAHPAIRTLEELADAYSHRDDEVLRFRALASSRRRQAGLVERLGSLDASLPAVLPTLGADPRFGGSGLTSSAGLGFHLERHRLLEELEKEASALDEEVKARESRARFRAVEEALALRLARLRERTLERELIACDAELRLASSRLSSGAGSRSELLRARRAREETRERLVAAVGESLRIEKTMALRAGRPVSLDAKALELPAAEAGAGAAETLQRWIDDVARSDPERVAAAERAGGAMRSAAWRRREGWLSTRLELVGTLGQSPEEARGGGGGFLALPLNPFLGLGGSNARLDEIAASRHRGEEERRGRRAAERSQELALRAEELGREVAQSRRELELARSAFRVEKRAHDARVRGAGDLELASGRFLAAESAYLELRAVLASAQREIDEVSQTAGTSRPPRRLAAIPAIDSESRPGELDRLAASVVEELTALPRGGLFELEELEERLRALEAALAGVDELPFEEAARRLGIFASIAAALEGAAAEPELLASLQELERLARRRRQALIEASSARTLGERLAALREPVAPGLGRPEPAGGDGDDELADAWGALAPRLSSLEAVNLSLRSRLRDRLAKERLDLLERRRALGADRIGLESEPARLRLADLGLAPRDGGLEASGMDVLEPAVDEVRRAKLLDAMARGGERHQAKLRADVERIDLHGKYRRLVDAVALRLRSVCGPSNAALSEAALRLQRAQLAREETRLGSFEAAGGSTREEAWLFSELEAGLPPELSRALERVRSLRERVEVLSLEVAGSQWSAAEEKDVIARGLAAARALDAGAELAEARRELRRELDVLLEREASQALLGEIGGKLAARRLERLQAAREEAAQKRARLAAAGERVAEPSELEKLIAALRSLASGGGHGSEMQALEDALEALRPQAARSRLAVERCLAEAPQRHLSASPLSRALALEQRELLARAAELESAWVALLEKLRGGGAPPEASLARGVWRRKLAARINPALWLGLRPGSGAPYPEPVEEVWRSALAERLVSEILQEEKMQAGVRRALSSLLHRLAFAAPPEREGAAARLIESRRLPASAGGEDLERLLFALLEAARLRDFSWELQELYQRTERTAGDVGKLGESGGIERTALALGITKSELELLLGGPQGEKVEFTVSLLALESVLLEAARRGGAAETELRLFFEDYARRRPGELSSWLERAGLLPPPPRERYAALRQAQKELEEAEERARFAGVALARAKEQARASRGWLEADREVEILRREEVFRKLRPELYDELVKKGYIDQRGRLLSFSELLARDYARAQNAVQIFAGIPSSGALTHLASHHELLGFLDGQLLRQVVESPSTSPAAAAPAGRALIAFSRTYEGRDESFSFEQALHAMACLLLFEPRWQEDGREKAEWLLEQALLHAWRRRTSPEGYRGHPRMFLASSGEVGDEDIEAGTNAALVLAAQLHASITGSTRFLGLAKEVLESVLLPLVAEDPELSAGWRSGILVDSPLKTGALIAAALRNQALIARALEGQGDPQRFAQLAERQAQWLLQRSFGQSGPFTPGAAGAIEADAALTALAVLGQDDRLREESIHRAVASLKGRLDVAEMLKEHFEREAFHGNWLLGGVIEAHNRFVVPLAKEVAEMTIPELEEEDGWLFLNHCFFRLSGSRLGFSAMARGLAQDSSRERIDLASTAQALWTLNLLARRIESVSQEGKAESIQRFAAEYRRELIKCTLADGRNPLWRGWPRHLGSQEAARNPGAVRFQGLLSTLPACYWVFARSAQRGDHPFLPKDFSRLGDAGPVLSIASPAGMKDGMEQNALARLEANVRDLEGTLRAKGARLEALVEVTRAEVERLAGGVGGRSDRPAPMPMSLLRSLLWLETQVDAASGLVRANEEEPHLETCRPYPAALAVIHFSLAAARGGDERHLSLARRLWEAMQGIRDAEGSWADAYDRPSRRVLPDSANRATGPNSWMVLAGLHLYEACGDRQVLEEARATLDWVLRFQDEEPSHGSFGAVTLGLDSHAVPLSIISTEANADALAAAWGMARALGTTEGARHGEAARRIASWLTQKMWRKQPAGGYFATGSRRPDGRPEEGEELLDSQTWTFLALDATFDAHGFDPARFNGLPALGDQVTKVLYGGRELSGFAKVTSGPPAFWTEGVAGYILAARAAAAREGRPRPKPERFLADLEAARNPDGTQLHIIGPEGAPWPFNLRVRAVDGTVWAVWADLEVDFNPFRTGSLAAAPARGAGRSATELEQRIAEERRALEALGRELEAQRRLDLRIEELREGIRRLKAEVGAR